MTDCVIVGAGFAGLACATALAQRGHGVCVLEKKSSVEEELRTTGILVKEAIDQIPLLEGLPRSLLREVPAVRLYARDLRSVRLKAQDYFFLATDTPGLMRWLARRATAAGVEIRYRSAFSGALPHHKGWDLREHGRCRFLVGADGAHSPVAASLGLGRNRHLLHGIEYEYRLAPDGPHMPEDDALHCFVNRSLAPGYIAWVLRGVTHLQVGLARSGHRPAPGLKSAMNRLEARIRPIVDLGGHTPNGVRAGPIPCGGLVWPLARPRALLVGDASGMVSPLTAGGIHTALRYGTAAGSAIADALVVED
jgi:flavin-dependent dehydrogenase